MKKLIAACIDRILEFDTQQEAQAYLKKRHDKNFRIVSQGQNQGKYRLRVQEQYNQSPMIDS